MNRVNGSHVDRGWRFQLLQSPSCPNEHQSWEWPHQRAGWVLESHCRLVYSLPNLTVRAFWTRTAVCLGTVPKEKGEEKAQGEMRLLWCPNWILDSLGGIHLVPWRSQLLRSFGTVLFNVICLITGQLHLRCKSSSAKGGTLFLLTKNKRNECSF